MTDLPVSHNGAAEAARVEEILRERAAKLADRGAAAEEIATVPVLAFTLGAERYALELEYLREVLPHSGCTPVPGAPPEFLGVLNLRGEIRPVADLARLLRIPVEDEVAYLLVLRSGVLQVALAVTGVEQIRHLAPSVLAPPEHKEGAGGISYVKGLTPDLLILLDGAALAAHPALGGAR